jgi:hypothetical protein
MTSSSNQYKEGLSIQRPPLFDGSNYNYWKCRMRIYLQSMGYDTWNIVETPYEKPTTPYSEWTTTQKTNANLDSKAMNALFCAMDKSEFNRVSTASNAHEIWHILEVTHEGTSKVKETKISVLVHRFELFKMKEKETIAEMFTRFTDITNSLIALGKKYTQVEMVRKILRALTSDWEKKTTAIEEANDLSKLTVENLIGNLMAYEVQLEDRKRDDEPKIKSLAFKAAESEIESENEDEDEFAFFTRKFRKFLKKGKYNNSKFKKSTDFSSSCFNCNKSGHFKKDCPLLQQRTKPTSFEPKKFNKFKRKALAATWDDSSDSSSDEEEKEKVEEQSAHMCFMANDEEVSNQELLEAFNDLLENYKRLKTSHRFLKGENDRLNFELVTSTSSQLDGMTKDYDKLLLENNTLSKENVHLKNECHTLNSRISDLDSSISILKSKYDCMFLNVTKFNKGKENLNSILSIQKPLHDKVGIGFIKPKHTHVSRISKPIHHAYKYAKPYRPKTGTFRNHIKPSICDNLILHRSHDTIRTSHDRTHSIPIWVPKNLSSHDRNTYILDYRKTICNSEHYFLSYKGRSNPTWVWFPKN